MTVTASHRLCPVRTCLASSVGRLAAGTSGIDLYLHSDDADPGVVYPAAIQHLGGGVVGVTHVLAAVSLPHLCTYHQPTLSCLLNSEMLILRQYTCHAQNAHRHSAS